MMVNRHDGAVGPLSVNGRLIVQGDDTVMAYDAYNGLFLWEFKNPEAIRTGVFNNENPGNLAASDDAVFMFAGEPVLRDRCWRPASCGAFIACRPAIDGATHQWGYIAYRDGLLFGTATIRGEIEAAKRRRGKATTDIDRHDLRHRRQHRRACLAVSRQEHLAPHDRASGPIASSSSTVRSPASSAPPCCVKTKHR